MTSAEYTSTVWRAQDYRRTYRRAEFVKNVAGVIGIIACMWLLYKPLAERSEQATKKFWERRSMVAPEELADFDARELAEAEEARLFDDALLDARVGTGGNGNPIILGVIDTNSWSSAGRSILRVAFVGFILVFVASTFKLAVAAQEAAERSSRDLILPLVDAPKHSRLPLDQIEELLRFAWWFRR